MRTPAEVLLAFEKAGVQDAWVFPRGEGLMEVRARAKSGAVVLAMVHEDDSAIALGGQIIKFVRALANENASFMSKRGEA